MPTTCDGALFVKHCDNQVTGIRDLILDAFLNAGNEEY